MKIILHYQSHLFFLISVVLAFLFLQRLWEIHPIFIDSALRSQARSAIENIAEERGWLLSDVSIDTVRSKEVTIIHQPHVRGGDPSTCYLLQLTDSSLHPCDSAR